MQKASLSHQPPSTGWEKQDDVLRAHVKEGLVVVVVRETSSVCTVVFWLSGVVKATGEVATSTLVTGADVSVVTSEGACTSTSDVGGDSGGISMLWSGPAIAMKAVVRPR